MGMVIFIVSEFSCRQGMVVRATLTSANSGSVFYQGRAQPSQHHCDL